MQKILYNSNVEIHNSNVTDFKKPLVAPLWSPVFWLTERFRKATAPRILTKIAWSALTGGKDWAGDLIRLHFLASHYDRNFLISSKYYDTNLHLYLLNHKKFILIYNVGHGWSFRRQQRPVNFVSYLILTRV